MEEGRIPIMIDGKVSGYVDITSCGAAMAFEAKCSMQEGIFRLSVYGENEEGYLGVMVPEGGYLTLSRKLSRLQMNGFPARAIEAGPSGRGGAGEAHEEPTNHTIRTDELVWYSSPEGVLVSFDGERSLVAFRLGCEPANERGGEIRIIDGREYKVYITLSNRIIG